MANKQLTASVRLNTTQFESRLKRIARGIDALNNSVRKQTRAYDAVNNALRTTQTRTNKAKVETDKLANSANKVNNNFQKTNNTLGTMGSKLKALASAYLGIQTARLIIDTSDTITSAQNKFNNLDGGSEAKTAESMDKIYAAAQRSRSSYTGMMSNVSKSMMLAGDSFQGDIDNAIRFQEIMSKAYTVGGATAQEQHSSMYQLVQALGAGTLAGDELRSVREGAPLAYKEIEKFAQKSLKTKESLKDLASQGVITSDIVVAAIMESGDKIEKKFKNTQMTFAQAWDMIKNTATKAFQPALESLNKWLNSDAGKRAIDAISQALVSLGNIFTWLIGVFTSFVTWFVDNWDWIKHIVVGALIIMATMWIYQAGVAVASCIKTLLAMSPIQLCILIIVAAILALIYVFIMWRNGAISTCDAIVSALLIVGIAVALIGLLMGNWIVVVVGLAIAAIGLIIKYLDYFLAFVYSVTSVIWNIIVTLVTAIIKNAIGPLLTAWDNFANFFGNLFNDPVTAIIRCFEKLADTTLSILQTIAQGIDAIFGSNLADKVQGWRDGLANKADALAVKYGNGTYEEKSNITDKVFGALDSVQTKLLWDTSDAWNTGMEHGAAAKDWMNEWGSKFQNQNSKLSLPNVMDDKYDVTGSYDPTGANEDILKGIDKLGTNTDDINDKMDLGDDDLDYLRKIAEMEWRKEFTTAEIKVDMTNNNTVNGERDLDGIVTYLSDVLREEMSNVADGVHY